MSCKLVFYYTDLYGSGTNRDITKNLSGIAVSLGGVVYSNNQKWSDVSVTFEDGTTQTIALIRNNSSKHTATSLRLVDCTPEQKKYDCVNASCVDSKQYNTPGIFTSLSQCEITCGTGCSGQCVSNEEWNKIQSLANQLRN